MKSSPLPSIPTQPTPPSIDIISTGIPIPAIDRLRIMNSSEWEDFILEWAHSLTSRYAKVDRCGGAGDMGRDVIAYCLSGQTDPWDNYQCKHYNHALHPNDIWIELGKLCYYTSIGEYSYPRNYYFVAPQGCGNSLSQLLRSPIKLKAQLLQEWPTKCESKITSSKAIPLDSKMLAYINSLDFSIFIAQSPLIVIEEHSKTCWHAARFGGGLPVRATPQIPPITINGNETIYVRALLDAYEDRLKYQLSSDKDLTDPHLMEHFRRSRHEFYSAESLREFSKDNVPQGTFDQLKQEIHSGVVDVVDGTHADAVDRVLATVKQAKALPLASNALITRVTNQDKGGICHQLANDSKIKWRP